MFVHSDEVKIDPEGRVHTFCHAVRGKWHMMGVNLSAGGSLQWFRNALCQADVAEAKKKKVDAYDLAHRRGRGRGRRQRAACSSCPIFPASGRRTPTPTPAAASSA